MKKLLISAWALLLSICTYSQTNNAPVLNGTNQYAFIDYDAALNPNTVFTVSVWVKVEAGGYLPIVNSQDGNTGYALYRNATNEWEFWIGTGTSGSGSVTLTASVQSTNQWTNITGTFDGSNMILYVNGLNVGETTGISGFTPAVTATPFLIGKDDNDNYFTGIIDELRIWNSVRTQEQIRENMHIELASLSTNYPDLVVYHRLNVIVNESFRDATANNFHATAVELTNANLIPSAAFYGPVTALSFDGTDDYVDCGTIAINEGDFTIEAWIYPTYTDTDVDHPIFGSDGDFGLDSPPALYTRGTKLIGGFGNGTEWIEYEVEGLTMGEWNHVAASLQTNRYRLSINGNELLSKNNATDHINPGTDKKQYIGGQISSGDNKYFKGYIDEIRIWSIDKTEGQIIQGMNINILKIEDELLMYYNADMAIGTMVPDYAGTADGEIMGGGTWTGSDAFNVWIGNSTVWNNAANWSRGSVPGSADNCSDQGTGYEDPVINSVVEINSLCIINPPTPITINAGASLQTEETLFLNSKFYNNGTNIVKGRFMKGTNNQLEYNDNGTTTYNGSIAQEIVWENFNNLVINNNGIGAGDSVYAVVESVTIDGDLSVEDGRFVTPDYMSVSGNIDIGAGAEFKIPITSEVDVANNFNSLTENELELDGHINIGNNLSFSSNIFGYGSVRAATYTLSPTATVFGLDPVEGRAAKASTWTGEEGTNDWDAENNWGQKKAKYKPSNKTDVYIVPEYNDSQLWPEINISNAEAKTLEMEGNAANLIITENGNLTVQGPGNSPGGGEFNVHTSASLTIDGEITVDKDLTIENASVTFKNGAYGLILLNVNVNPGGELNLEGGSEVFIGGASGVK